MTYELTLRVIYPLQSGRMVLRTDTDWSQNIEADVVSGDHTISEFRLSSNQPYFYFKPCIVDGENFRWCQGTNYLGIMNLAEGKDIYPYFFDHLSGSISEPFEIPSEQMGTRHALRVYYPPGYAENTLERYPVLYMHDGKNLFFPDEAFNGGAWQVNQTMDLMDAMNIIQKTVIVGIYAADRMNEYTRPGYEIYGQFIVNELVPWVNGKVRTLTEPQNTAVMGSSLGGVVSFYLAWQWPLVFGKAACLSSTFNYRDDLMARVDGEAKRPIKIYLDSGWPEDNYEVTRALRDLLILRGYEAGRDLLYLGFPQALHNEKYWAMRSHIPFQFFFGRAPMMGISGIMREDC